MAPVTTINLNFKTQSYVHLRSLNLNIYYIFQQTCSYMEIKCQLDATKVFLLPVYFYNGERISS